MQGCQGTGWEYGRLCELFAMQLRHVGCRCKLQAQANKTSSTLVAARNNAGQQQLTQEVAAVELHSRRCGQHVHAAA